jgi:hypothetical protein
MVTPSTFNVKALAEPLVPSTHSVTQVVPPTVAPPVGRVMTTSSVALTGGSDGGGSAGVPVPPLLPTTVIVILVLPVFPAASRTVPVNAWVPFAAEASSDCR